MKLRNLRLVGCVFGITALILASGCSSAKKNQNGEDGGVPTAASADENSAGDSDSGTAKGLQTVFFPYDSSVLSESSKATLKANADVLKSNSALKVQIEGHCDQRGGIQYNIALGERRANSTKKYLVDLGVPSKRMTVISMGKEKLLDQSNTEEAYAKNRRANFAITAQ